MLGQIPLIAIDSQVDDLAINDNIFTGTGEVVCPFDSYEITGDPKFAGYLPNKHVFVSRYPCYDDMFYLFVLEATDVLDLSNADFRYYLQGEVMSEGSFTFSYYRMTKPFKISKVNFLNPVLPFTYASRQARTGVIPGVNINLQSDNEELVTPDDMIDNYIDHDTAWLLHEELNNWADLEDDDVEITGDEL